MFFFEKNAVIAVEAIILFFLLDGFDVQEAEYPVGEHSPQFTDKSALLEQFAAQIERNVLDDTFAESQPFRLNVFCLVLDQHLAAINADPRFRLRTHVEKSGLPFDDRKG